MRRLACSILIWFSMTLPAAAEPLQILFIGNSFTNEWNVAGMVRAIAESAKVEPNFPGCEIEARNISQNGMTLTWHLREGGAATVIGAEAWDHVVLQDFSDVALIEDKRAASAAAARGLAAAAHATGASAVFFAPWAPQKVAHRDRAAATEQIDRHYRDLADSAAGRIAPVGRAWRHELDNTAPTALRAADDHHATEAGAYLAALVIAVAILDAPWILEPDRTLWRPPTMTASTGMQLRASARQSLTADKQSHATR